MIAVVDACAVLRLFIPDGPIPRGFESFMRGVERGEHLAVAPELLMAETTHALLKKTRRGYLTDKQGRELITLIRRTPIRFYAHQDLAEPAFELALATKLTVYDALYVVLARRHGLALFSADDDLCREAEQAGIRVITPNETHDS